MPRSRRYQLGDTVYHRMAAEERPGMVTTICESLGGTVYYCITWGHTLCESRHYEGELTDTYVPDYARDHSGGSDVSTFDKDEK